VKETKKKKKKVDYSTFHPHFHADTHKNREPRNIALQFGLLYKGTEYELEGCINDIRNIRKNFLEPLGFHTDHIIESTDDTHISPTKAHMEGLLSQFVRKSIHGDRLFLQYSGHGTEVRDKSGDEKDGKDEAFCPLDGGVIVDDWIFLNVVKHLSEKKGTSLFVLVDACHSGTCLDLNNQYYATRGEKPSIRSNLEKNKTRNTDARVLGFSAAMDDQTATDIQGDQIPQGAFTEMFIEVFKKHQKKKLSYREFILQVDGLLAKAGYAQQASLSSSHQLHIDQECRFWI